MMLVGDASNAIHRVQSVLAKRKMIAFSWLLQLQ